MTSGLKGAGLKALTQYLMEQACLHHLHFILMICVCVFLCGVLVYDVNAVSFKFF